MYAVVRTGGKQYRVQEGRALTIERLPGGAGDVIELGDVLLMAEGGDITVGTPTIPGARVVGTIEEQGRSKKVIVFRYKNKTRARKKNGHRQQFTRLVVSDILAAGQDPKPKQAEATPAEAEAAAEAPKNRRARKPKAVEAAVPETPVAAEAEVAAGPVADEPAEAPAADPGRKVRAAAKPKRARKKAE